MRIIISGLGLLLTLSFAAPLKAAEIDWAKVDAALGKTASVQGEVHRYGIPRTDLQVTLDGVAIKPALALGGWLAFEPMKDEAVVMGDLVLTETEVNPVMSKLLESGIDITAVHNHLMRGTPTTLYMHIHGHGDPVALATAIRAALAESKTPFAAPAAPAAQTAQIELDTDKLDAAIGVKGKVNGGVYQFSVPRKDPITENGMPVPPAMGTAIAINFQPTGAGKAAITGDFVITAQEVNPLIRALRENGIEVTAIHTHMLDEQPRLFFVHFWANDDAIKLAKGLQAALEKIAVARD
jgi:biotin operon repressor